MTSVRPLLLRGLLAGLFAGVLAFVVAKTLGESQVGQAIGFETARSAAEGAPEEPELVSRTLQSTLGLLTATTVFGVAIGGLYALGFAAAQGRLGRLAARPTAALVALLGFLGAYLLPFLKYPANPPAVGNPDTIGRRTALYLLMIVLSLMIVVGSAVLARSLQGRFGGWDAFLIALAAGLVATAVVYAVLPAVSETPGGFPADVLWRFRVASVAIQVTVWTTLALVFGALVERASVARPESRRDLVTASSR